MSDDTTDYKASTTDHAGDPVDRTARAAYFAYVAARAEQARSPWTRGVFQTYDDLPEPERAVWRAVARACAPAPAPAPASTEARWPEGRFPGQVLVAISFDDLLAIDRMDGLSAVTWLKRVVAIPRFKVAVFTHRPATLSAIRVWLRNFPGVLCFKRGLASRHVLVETKSIDAAGYDLSEDELRLLSPWQFARAREDA
jgi:hypothetical protein